MPCLLGRRRTMPSRRFWGSDRGGIGFRNDTKCHSCPETRKSCWSAHPRLHSPGVESTNTRSRLGYLCPRTVQPCKQEEHKEPTANAHSFRTGRFPYLRIRDLHSESEKRNRGRGNGAKTRQPRMKATAVAQALIGHDSEAMHELHISVARE